MAKGILSALAVLVITIVGYCVYFNWATSKRAVLASEDAGLSWVKTEFGLTDSQFAKFKAANADYSPRCEAMCMRLAEARRSLATLAGDRATQQAEIETAYAKVSEVETQCVNMTLKHIYSVSELMNPEEGARYRKQMIAQLMNYHTGHHQLHSEIVRTQPHADASD